LCRQLVENMQEALSEVEWQDSEEGLREVLHAAHKSATALGSATLILAAGGTNGIVHVANLGDCGLRLIHEGICTFATQVRLPLLSFIYAPCIRMLGML
jgi:protein phosphatase PTC7